MKKILMSLVMISVLMLSVGFVIAAKLPKVDICHQTESINEYVLINVNGNAVSAHEAHGDGLPGEGGLDEECNEVVVCTYSVEETVASYDGLYGSTVTPVTITNEDCSTVEALKIETTQNFQDGQPDGQSAGWAGWSCVEPEYPQVIGGGYNPEGADILNSLAWDIGASVGEFNYPTTPWGYSYADGETGWIVQAAGTTPPTSVYVLCAA